MSPDPPPPAADWRAAPLFPVAVAVTVGLALDRYGQLPLAAAVALLLGGAGWWLLAWGRRRRAALGLIGLWVAAAGCGAAYHFSHRDIFEADDIGFLAGDEPQLVRLRGVLLDAPVIQPVPPDTSFLSLPRPEVTVYLVGARAVEGGVGWRGASGRVRVVAGGAGPAVSAGDGVEVTGWLSRPAEPLNPGEFDGRAQLHDRRILAELRDPDGGSLVPGEPAAWYDPAALLARLRGYGQEVLRERLPERSAALARALVLGDQAALARDEWERYVRTGVVHVLAVSGQHLVVLAGFVWAALCVAGVGHRRAALASALLAVSYALLTGVRPPVLRAAAAVAAGCAGAALGRRAGALNTMSLAWLLVVAVRPADPFSMGCQFSFFCVAVLAWGVGPWRAGLPSAKDELPYAETPFTLFLGRKLLRWLTGACLATALVSAAVAPLGAWWQGVVSPASLPLGVPLIVLTAAALAASFVVLALHPLGPVADAPAWLAHGCLWACESLAGWAEACPGAWWYVPPPPGWWAAGYLAWVLAGWLWPAARKRWRLFAATGAVWLLVGLAAALWPAERGGLRVTFLAVGHGGCAVLELPDGRALLYDAGSLAGPEVARRVVAPYLLSRRVRRVEAVFLSHADLDHFNALPALLDRVAVARVLANPSFADKPTPAVRGTLEALRRRGVSFGPAVSGERVTLGEVSLEVLHPPPRGPAGPENVRSLTLFVRHAGHSLLLTGDLEGAGLERVLRVPAPAGGVDVLQSPHHGSRAANPPALAAWARPRLVVASQARPRWPAPPDPYEADGATVLRTHRDGSVTVTSTPDRLTAEAFRTGRRYVVREK